MRYTELHFHLLAGVDDGPSCAEDSIALARAAVADGTRTVVATPHVHPAHITSPLEIPARVAELRDHLWRERIPLEVLPGGELAHDMVQRLSDAELEAIAQGPPGRRWVLLEAPFDGLDERFTAAAEELRGRGFAIVAAHPERAVGSGSSCPSALRSEVAAGTVLQLTAWSFAGLNGERARTVAMRLISSSPRVVIASDAHGAVRMPSLRLALDALRAAGVADPVRFVDSVPRMLLERGLSRDVSVTTRYASRA